MSSAVLENLDYIKDWLLRCEQKLQHRDSADSNLRVYLILKDLLNYVTNQTTMNTSDTQQFTSPIVQRQNIFRSLRQIADINPMAMFLEGLALKAGFGCSEVDHELGDARIIIAAKVHLLPDALNALGLRHAEFDPIVAAKLFHLAADQGHCRASKNLGLLYASGRGVQQNYANALKYLHNAGAIGFLPLTQLQDYLRRSIKQRERTSNVAKFDTAHKKLKIY